MQGSLGRANKFMEQTTSVGEQTTLSEQGRPLRHFPTLRFCQNRADHLVRADKWIEQTTLSEPTTVWSRTICRADHCTDQITVQSRLLYRADHCTRTDHCTRVDDCTRADHSTKQSSPFCQAEPPTLLLCHFARAEQTTLPLCHFAISPE